MMSVTHTANTRVTLITSRLMNVFGSFLNPENFDLAECEEKDCFHPCFGGWHESFCNECSSGFFRYVRALASGSLDQDAKNSAVESLKKVCGQCKSAGSDDLPIPVTKSFEEFFPKWIPDDQWEEAFNVTFPTFEEANPKLKSIAQFK